ncbi:MAG: LamG-like jellyroll fold domain-containing protein [Verrucomicrobiales bacterium]
MKPTRALFHVAVYLSFAPATAFAELKAGAAVVDVTPVQFPVVVNGGILSSSASKATSRLYARAIVLDDGRERLAIMVADSCMMPRELLDEAKQLTSQRTNIRPERILISATHTHSAPASMGALGTEAEPTYVPFLREKLAAGVAAAAANLEPARVGWAVTNAAEFTALRRWIIRPDRIETDPFGNPTVRANMHAGANWDNVTGESGPEDPDLSLISFQSLAGRPIAVLANFSMHYYAGVEPLNYDYFGLFCEGLQTRIGGGNRDNDHGKPADADHPSFVALMSHGCSGDIWRRDYTKPAPAPDQQVTIENYTRGLVDLAASAYGTIAYRADAGLAMAESRMELKYRVPDKQRLQWAQQIVAAMGDRPPRTTEEVYAREQVLLHERQSTSIVVQALRIGDIAIASTPNETYALTGLKLKLQSPLPRTMVIELANGGDGYIPPPEQHFLGGYNTWPARSAGLEVNAEPKITETALALLEKVAGQPRRRFQQSRGPAAAAILDARPEAYWRLDEFAGQRASDSSGHDRPAFYEPGVVFFLAGPRSDAFCQAGEPNRAAHFAGGRLESRLAGLGGQYSVSLWFWNGMPNDGRETAGWMFSRGGNHGLGPHGDHVGIGGTASEPGKLIFLHGDDRDGAKPVAGRTVIGRWTWNHVLFVRDGGQVQLYLNGNPEPELGVESPAAFPPSFDQIFFGGRSDNIANWEGRLDEIAVFDHALSAQDLRKLTAP